MRLVREKGGKHERHEEIRRLLRARRISTQQELAELLAAQGIETTQATLSRDLAELGVLRVSRPEGAVYELEPVNAIATPQLAELGETILSLRDNDTLVVVRTLTSVQSSPGIRISFICDDQSQSFRGAAGSAPSSSTFTSPIALKAGGKTTDGTFEATGSATHVDSLP